MKHQKQLLRVMVCPSLVSLAVCVGLLPAFTQTNASKPTAQPWDAPGYWSAQRKASVAFADYRWLTERWTASDTPFAMIRTRIEDSFATGADPQILLTQYESAAKRNPMDAGALFGWGYTVKVVTRIASFHLTDEPDYLNSVNAALAEAPSPHSYNYDRLRYILWFQEVNGWSSHYLTRMGERLLKRDPNDFPVQIIQATIFTENDDPTARKKGFDMLHRLIRQYPAKPAVYDALACWYDTEMYYTHRSDDYHMALVYYQKAYDLYPVTAARRAQIPGVIQYVHQQYQRLTGT